MKVFFLEELFPTAQRHLEETVQIIRDWDRIGEADGIISRSLPITEKELDLAKNLKVIGAHGTGYDHIDVAAAKARGIDFFSSPHLNAQSVAELETGLILALARRIQLADRMMCAGGGKMNHEVDSPLLGREICGKTLGVIGVGHVGILTANILKNGFGMEVLGYDPFFTPERAKELGYTWCADKEEVLRRADVVSLNVPLTPETRLMMGAAQFAMMKPSAYFVNLSRGMLVDEDALYDALTKGVIAGAALDVRQKEPPQPDDRFLSLPNVVLTPHIGGDTEESLNRAGFYVVDEMVRRLKEKGVE